MPDDVSLYFTIDEYQQRLSRTRDAMEQRGLDVLFVSDPSNMAWLTGYDAWSFYTFQGVIVGMDGDPVYWGRNQDTNAARRTTWMTEDDVIPYPDNFVQSTERHPMQHLATVLTDRNWHGLRIGVELDNYYYSAKADHSLRSSLKRDDLVDATGLVNWLRALKSDRELEYMKIAGSIVEKMFERVFTTVRPGIRKNDLVAEIYHAGIGGTADHGGDYPAIVPLLPTGVDASASHLTWNDQPMERGAGTFFELAGCYRRYHCPLSRSVFLGDPPAMIKNAEAALLEGIEAGLDVARAGNQARDIAKALGDVMANRGLDRGGARCGYSIGLSYPPDWGERTISFRPEDETELKPGMTFHFMPGLWMDTWGLEITESIVITDEGRAQCLSNVARQVTLIE